MPQVTTEALALRRTPFGESSQVAEFLTRDAGRVSLILKGVHRDKCRMGGPVDLLDHCVVTWHARKGSRSLAPLRERKVLCHHPGLRSREDLLAAGLALIELLQALVPEGQRLVAVFDRSVAFLSALESRPPPGAVPAVVFALEGGLLRMAGFQPVLDRCVACERQPTGHRALRCDPGRGGIVCSQCRRPEDDTFPLSAEGAELVMRLSGSDPRELTGLVLPAEIEADLRRFFWRTWTHVLERRPRSLAAPKVTA